MFVVFIYHSQFFKWRSSLFLTEKNKRKPEPILLRAVILSEQLPRAGKESVWPACWDTQPTHIPNSWGWPCPSLLDKSSPLCFILGGKNCLHMLMWMGFIVHRSQQDGSAGKGAYCTMSESTERWKERTALQSCLLTSECVLCTAVIHVYMYVCIYTQ